MSADAQASDPDPTPWLHVDGLRVSDPGADGAPRGGYMFAPRHGYSDHPTRFISKRFGDRCSQCREVAP